MSEAHARDICTWSYAPPYDVYSMGPWSLVVEQGWTLADPEARVREMLSILDETNILIGYIRLFEQDGRTMLGLGLHPEHCDRGLGTAATALALAAHGDRSPDTPLWLEVRDWNERAIRCYERAGFAIVDRIPRTPPTGPGTFVVMKHEC